MRLLEDLRTKIKVDNQQIQQHTISTRQANSHPRSLEASQQHIVIIFPSGQTISFFLVLTGYATSRCVGVYLERSGEVVLADLRESSGCIVECWFALAIYIIVSGFVGTELAFGP